MINRAKEILNQPAMDLGDVQELSKILVELSILQWEYWELAATLEHKYFLEKSDLISKAIRTGLAYNKSENQALQIVERKYGYYRIKKEQSRKYATICNRLESYIKLWMHKNKAELMAMNAQIEL